jgi:hypothetical protein
MAHHGRPAMCNSGQSFSRSRGNQMLRLSRHALCHSIRLGSHRTLNRAQTRARWSRLFSRARKSRCQTVNTAPSPEIRAVTRFNGSYRSGRQLSTTLACCGGWRTIVVTTKNSPLRACAMPFRRPNVSGANSRTGVSNENPVGVRLIATTSTSPSGPTRNSARPRKRACSERVPEGNCGSAAPELSGRSRSV